MIQRISVRALIQQDNKILVLRRANGRPSILGLYELPGGKLGYGEQPEDTLRRYLHNDAGLHIKTAQLYDAVTYIDHDDRNVQYVVIVYIVSLAAGHHDIQLSGNYSKYKWHTMSKGQQSDMTDLTQLLLGIMQQRAITEGTLHISAENDVKKSSNSEYTIYTDGGSRGNPGPSASGYIIIDPRQQVVAQGGEYIGITTNNLAEYQGVLLALEKARELDIKRINFKLDSMLVVNQMNGFYNIKNRELWPVHERIRELMKTFEHITFSHVQREFNQLADGMVNKVLNEHAKDSRPEPSS